MRVKHCPTRGCGATIRREVLMCQECWGRLPASLQRRIDWMDARRADSAVLAEALDYLDRQPPLPTLRFDLAAAV